ncbi:MAG: tetratricopeptide repeat protein [bacterium]|nr:tetratricopeptide repeat protein [bacterium]
MEEKHDYLKYIKQSFELKNQKLYKEAIEALYKVLSDDVDRKTLVEVISQIGDLHILLKNYDRAIEQYEKVLEIDPLHEHSKNKLYEIYFELKEFDKALLIVKEICKTSKNPLDFVKYFSALLKTGKSEEIFREYEKLDENLKDDPNILYIISLLSDDNKKEILTKVVNAAPTFNEAKFDLGMIYYNEGDFEKAESFLDDVLKTKKDPLCYYYKAVMQILRKDYFPAIDNLHLAIKTSKGVYQEFYFELAKAYMDVNWFEEAIATIKNSITLCIKNNEDKSVIDKRYLLLAWVFEKQNDFDNALFNLTLIDVNSPVRLQSDILKALIAYKKGDIVKAKMKLEELYEKFPQIRSDLTLLDTLGAIYKDLKLNNKACEFYEKHLEQYPDSIHSACEYVDLLIDMTEYDKAEEIIEKFSSYGKVASFLNSKARIYFRKEEYEKALECLDELLINDKNNAETYYFKGLILNKTGRYKEAVKFFESALELNPVHAKYYAQCAYAHYNLGFYNEAMLYIKEAIEIEPNDLNYKKQAAEIAKKAGREHEAGFWNSIVNRTETIIRENQRF